MTELYGRQKGPYAVICRAHGQVFLTDGEYSSQMDKPDNLWICPLDGEVAMWDDDNLEQYITGEGEEG